MNFNTISWIKKVNNINEAAFKTPNRLDDSSSIRGQTVQSINIQTQTDNRVNISDAVFNNVPQFGPGALLPYNKARLKLFGPKVEKIENFIGKRRGINHI